MKIFEPTMLCNSKTLNYIKRSDFNCQSRLLAKCQSSVIVNSSTSRTRCW